MKDKNKRYRIIDSDTNEIVYDGYHVMDILKYIAEEPWCGFSNECIEGFYKSKDKEPRCLVVEKTYKSHDFDLGVIAEFEPDTK